MKGYVVIGIALITAGILTALNIPTAAAAADHVVLKAPFGKSKPVSKGGTQILYHGGKILSGTTPLYVIYYGGTGAFPVTSQPIINAFLAGLGGTPQFDVNTTYCNVNTTNCPDGGTSISGQLSFDTSHIFYDSGSQGANISTKAVPKIVEYALTAQGHLPVVAGAIYIVIPAPDIKVGGFCTSFCAYHTSSTTIVSGATIRYALAPEPNSKCTACDGNFAIYGESTTPNGDPGADEIVDSLMHELSETVTDPDIGAWYTPNGEENGDLCNYNYGTATFPSQRTGATSNATWGGYDYLIQLIWENRPLPQGCAAAP